MTRTSRRMSAVLLLVLVVCGFFLREAPRPPDHRRAITVTPLPPPSPAQVRPHLGAFRFEGLWEIDSRNPTFGGYSALTRLCDGRFQAVSDRGFAMRFFVPGQKQDRVWMTELSKPGNRLKSDRDAEAATYDRVTGRTWIAWEDANAITRHGPDLRQEARVRPAAMRHWSSNSGPEALTRLADGRFLVIAEGFTGWLENRDHEALLFPGDPTRADTGEPRRLRLRGPARFSPTDVAQMPDGRLLVLMRRVVWPLPFRFVGRIAIADPRTIRADGVLHARTVAWLSSSLPVDNFEGIVVEPAGDERIAVWLLSDDNNAVTQRTLMWKLTVDPGALR